MDKYQRTIRNIADRQAALQTFHVGQRVQAHPATDTWMRGDRFGTVAKIGRKTVHVAMDRSGRTVRFAPSNLLDAT